MKTVKPLLVVGTRPEAIKMAPVILKCQQHPAVNPVVCFTGQHQQMLDQVAGNGALNSQNSRGPDRKPGNDGRFRNQASMNKALTGHDFGLNPDVNLHVMQPNQTLSSLTTRCLAGLNRTIQRYTPDCVVN